MGRMNILPILAFTEDCNVECILLLGGEAVIGYRN